MNKNQWYLYSYTTISHVFLTFYSMKIFKAREFGNQINYELDNVNSPSQITSFNKIPRGFGITPSGNLRGRGRKYMFDQR